jgi:serine/threonine protein kinase/tetratricopeptide (TPR) repeat protein
LSSALEGRYRIEREVGEGGMATVYLAKDLRHGRNVALKLLKPDLAAAIGAERFLAEINTTANLQHPHILPLHDSGEADGLLFYTMPFVEGDTLRQRIEREGRLPIEEAVRIATDVADALEVAHERGVIHRDIKPSNILLSRGGALVADFGIARAAGLSEEVTRLTQRGVVIGTAGYMSPEQASGNPDVDHRADVYSLGCVLFEMLAGEPPWSGRTVLEVLMRQATEMVPSLRARRPEIAAALERAVSTALAREPGRRFVSAAAFAAALAIHDTEGRAGATAHRTLVVLPFVNRSADPDNEYFSDGLTDEVISDLSRVAALRVISRNSAMALKGTTKNTQTLARELGVTHLVTGSVRRSGSSLRITAELVDASNDLPIWSEKFSGSMEDVFGIQEDISRQIVAALKVRLTDTEERRVGERPISDPVAYDSYMRACHLMYNWTPEAQRRAVRLVDEAISISGDVPLLLAMKGQLEWNKVNIPTDPVERARSAGADEHAEQALARAAELAGRALALDPESHLAILVRGLVAGARGQPEAGLVDLYRAHTLHPGDANVLVELGRYSMSVGLDCRKHVDRLVALDPLSPQTHLLVAMYYGLYGPVEEAASPAYRAIELAPETSFLQVSAAWWLAVAGRRSDAVAVLDRIRSAASDLRGAMASFLRCALEGDQEGAVRAASLEMERAISNEFLWTMMAEGWGLLGRKEEAIRALRAAFELGFINYPSLHAGGAFLGDVRTERAYQALLLEMKPRWEAVVRWERGLGDEVRTLTARP